MTAAARTSRPHILLAEDDDELGGCLQTFLEQRGYRVTSVEDGFELSDFLLLTRALTQVATPDLILTDLRMPGKTSLEVFEQLGTPVRCPIVLISDFADPETYRSRAARAGVARVLNKPVDLPGLGALVADLGGDAYFPRSLSGGT